MPNKSWIVDMLSTFKKDDEIFAKSYVAPPIKKKKEKEIAVKSSLFADMPVKT